MIHPFADSVILFALSWIYTCGKPVTDVLKVYDDVHSATLGEAPVCDAMAVAWASPWWFTGIESF